MIGSNAVAIAAPSASIFPLMSPAMRTAPIKAPNQPASTAPSAAASSRAYENKVPVELTLKQNATPATKLKDGVLMYMDK